MGDPALERADLQVSLLEAFELRADGRVLIIPTSAERLVAFLALSERPAHRAHVAGTLWRDKPEARAAASLRTLLWKANLRAHVIRTRGPYLHLDAAVDVAAMEARARELIAGSPAVVDDDLRLLASDLLPDWYDEWVVFERERLRQLRLHALENLSVRFTEVGRHADAVEAAMLAVAGEPLRESAHFALMRAHLAEGNLMEAIHAYERLRRTVRAEVGVDPSPPPIDIRERLGPMMTFT